VISLAWVKVKILGQGSKLKGNAICKLPDL